MGTGCCLRYFLYLCSLNISLLCQLKKKNDWIECLRSLIHTSSVSWAGNDPCSDGNYKDLNNTDRSVTYIGPSVDDKCDSTDLANEWLYWYRVSGNAGNALAAVTPPDNDACGTDTQLYLEGSHPIPSDGKVTRTICSRTKNQVCQNQESIEVINCGAFYVYKLVDFKNCASGAWRYCTNGVEGESSLNILIMLLFNEDTPIITR